MFAYFKYWLYLCSRNQTTKSYDTATEKYRSFKFWP